MREEFEENRWEPQEDGDETAGFKSCLSCGFVFPSWADCCPECGSDECDSDEILVSNNDDFAND